MSEGERVFGGGVCIKKKGGILGLNAAA